MRAALFRAQGLNNLNVEEVQDPQVGPHDVLIRVQKAGVNPVDYFTVNIGSVTPMPHIPGAEFAGTVERIGDHVKGFSKGDRVIAYGRVFDGSCDMCISGREMLCRNGGIVGIVTNGGFAEYAVLPERNFVKIPDEISWEMAASMSVSALTSYHGLLEAGLKSGETLVVFGASGNTGQFAVQLGKIFGATVIAVSRKSWVRDLGADYVVTMDSVEEEVKKITEGRMAEVVLDPLGEKTWGKSFSVLSAGGRWVTFGALTGGEVKLNVSVLYGRHLKLLGTTGGTRRELHDLVKMSKKLKVKVGKDYPLDQARTAIEEVMSERRDGRIMITP